MTTLLSLNATAATFGPRQHHHHHHHNVQYRRHQTTTSRLMVASTLKSRPLTSSSSYSSLSLPVLSLDRVESFPIKSTGSLPDLSTMVSANGGGGGVVVNCCNQRNRASSLNDSLSILKSSSNALVDCPQISIKTINSNTMTVSPVPTPIESTDSDDVNNNNNKSESNNRSTINETEVDVISNPTTESTIPSHQTGGDVRHRKRSSMKPILPDIGLIAQMLNDDRQVEENEKEDRRLHSNTNINLHDDGKPINKLNPEWRECADQESAAAWLAAALQPSPQARRKNGGLLHLTTNGLAHSNLSGTISMINSNISVQPNLNTITKCNNTNDNGYSHHLNDQHLYKSNISSIQSVKPVESTLIKNTTTTTNNNNNNEKLQSTEPKVKPLQPFGKDDRVRRMSILRPSTNHNLVQPNQINNCPKKRVSFADANGMQLENIRYYEVKPPIHRRYSSYNAPTYLTNGNYNSPWNLALNGNVSDHKPFNIRSETSISTPINTNITTTNATTSASTITAAAATTITTTMLTSNQLVKEYDFNHSKLAPRYELMASNFTSPSLQLNFTETLSKKSVLLHSLTTAETTVYGTVSVMNVHFSKRVIVRYTFNEWKSHIEREATYMLGSHDGQSDKFSFVIYARPEDFSNNLATTFSVHHSGTYLANGADPIQSIHPRIYFAIRFIAGDGREFWDNNDGRNYCLNLTTY